jgi:transposase
MSKRFPEALKLRLIDRLIGVNAVSAVQLSRETGISQQNLSRWLNSARNLPLAAFGGPTLCHRTAEEKARVLLQAAPLNGDELVRYLNGEGVHINHYRRWRTALEEAGEQTVGMAKRITKLEHELARRDQALAEATTLLLLRESAKPRCREGDGAGEDAEGIDVSDLRRFVLSPQRLNATNEVE